MRSEPRNPVIRGENGISPNVVALGCVSLLMGMSSAMIHSVLPVFMVTVLGATAATVGVIEGLAEGTASFMKIASGTASDWIRRRRPLVLLGYGLSAVNKLLFPLAAAATTVLVARVVDRIGKGIRDAPRDALLADVTPTPIRGSGFGLRLALYTTGAVAGPLAASGLMAASGNDFRLVLWLAVFPALASVGVLYLFVHEPDRAPAHAESHFPIRRADLAQLSAQSWRIISVAALFALARFSPAFIVLKAHHAEMPPTQVPLMLVFMYLVYSLTAYPAGRLADRCDRRVQLGAGVAVLVAANLVLAAADRAAVTALGAALWGLQMGLTQSVLAASVADAAPPHLRGTTFGIYDFAVGVATFCASAVAGVLWTLEGPRMTFVVAAGFAAAVFPLLALGPIDTIAHRRL